MIVSHTHKFIFIKTAKTAGTSVEVDLCKALGGQDVATPITPPVEGHSARNFRYRKFGIFPKALYNHMPAVAVRNYLGRATFDSYFKFCVEREPVDKCISYYSMYQNSPAHRNSISGLSFDAFVQTGKFPIDTAKYVDKDGALLVDRIVKYETLAEELAEIGQSLGLDVSLKTRAKAGFREEIQPTEAQKRKIYDAFGASNAFTGYSL